MTPAILCSAVLAFASCLIGIRDTGPADQLRALLTKQNYVAVPMTGNKEHFTVPCRIGDESFRMLIDTGAHLSFIDEKLSRRLGLALGTERQWQMLGAVMTGCDVTVRGLQIGGFDTRLVGGGTTLVACDMSSLNDRFREQGEPPIAGIIGHRGFTFCSAVIDYPSKTLYLRTPVVGLWPKIEGEWIASRREEDGKADPIDPKVPSRVAFKNRELTLTDAGERRKFGFHVAPGDGCLLLLLYTPGEELAKEFHYRTAGLLIVDDNRLKIVLGIDPGKTKASASECTAPAGSGHLLLEFQRPKP